MEVLTLQQEVIALHNRVEWIVALPGLLVDEKPTLLVDGGVENYNSAVDAIVDSGMLIRLLAQTDISYTYSLIDL